MAAGIGGGRGQYYAPPGTLWREATVLYLAKEGTTLLSFLREHCAKK